MELSSEESAKKAWLSQIDLPTFSSIAATVAGVAATTAPDSEDAAKEAWLDKLDGETWSEAADALVEVAGRKAASEEQAKQRWLARSDYAKEYGSQLFGGSLTNVMNKLEKKCKSGDFKACNLRKEGRAYEMLAFLTWMKKIPLSSLHSMNKAIAVVSAEMKAKSMGVAMAPVDVAKQSWGGLMEARAKAREVQGVRAGARAVGGAMAAALAFQLWRCYSVGARFL